MAAGPKIRLVIDPGHGGEDPGAVDAATGLREADVTLGIARALMAILDTHPEFEPALTRDADRTVSLKERTDIANARDADLISIHLQRRARSADPRRGGLVLRRDRRGRR